MIGRIPILGIEPAVECGRRPAKAVAGETFQVSATVIIEGHGALGAAVVLRDPAGEPGPLALMRELAPGTDRYGADVTVTREGMWQFHVEAWSDPITHWHHDAAIKIPRGQDVELMLAEGALLFERAARAVRQPPGASRPAAARTLLAALARRLGDRSIPPWDRLAATEDPAVARTLAAYPYRELVTRSARLPVQVDRQRALYGSWYEFFPRSEGVQIDPMGRREPVSGTLRTAARRLDAIAEMGFDVVYLPPVHPIGTTFRKGRNNTLGAQPGDPGSPWAIGSVDGGHDSIHPDLGTFEDFDAFAGRARELGMEVALDLALQASPDHPWVKEHPEWFTTRADGSIAYAENPPKKYQDIYPLNFDNDPEGIYREMLRIVRLWTAHGVRVFRVDNPHTKPLRFWERLLADVRRTDPDVVFLAEAFTRPAMMATLAKIGFHQSYTYFTWRNSVGELTGYMRELSGPAAAYMRPNFFANTPDILNEYLQHGGPPAFRIRAVLAAMLSPSWGIYSGYELCENTPLRPGSEEYLDSEKFQYRPRDWAAAARDGLGIAPFITSLNRIRKSHPALHWLRNLQFHHVDQPELICFSKRLAGREKTARSAGTGSALAGGNIAGRTSAAAAPTEGGPGGTVSDTVLVVVNVDPHQTREATVWLDLPALGIDPPAEFTVTDELTGESYRWGQANYVRLDPAVQPAHIFAVTHGQGI
ncbi:MAG: alpha-1,4-glucan--maltose-1-phosphate maltosyltransferase [Streptosporangiaceae bacterium]|nr:alpha-1,4-glucan--maltose-1-phosphate maltosyltransferase [Streptosporangiaceae bacterium]MBV9855549.1 alpha-1,4-glucan--maltose-1-phosphate maltosyltransferase [Streptosporangiaceae bacterium]